MSDRQQVTNAKGDRIAIVTGLRTPFAKQARVPQVPIFNSDILLFQSASSSK